MNELQTELTQNEATMKSLDCHAAELESQARSARTKRDEVKRRQSELRALVNDARMVNAMETTAASAAKALQEAEAARTECTAAVAAMKAKLTELDSRTQKLDQLIAKWEAKLTEAAPVAA